MPLIDVDTFDRRQVRLAANQQKPAHFKEVEETYILTGKIFCGKCNSTMYGVSGTSRTGAKHRYYRCRVSYKKKTCDKGSIKKDFLETAVLDSIMALLEDTPLLERISETCYTLHMQQNAALPSLEAQLKQAEREINNVMKAIKKGIITVTTKEELLKLEQEKEMLVIAIAKEQIEKPRLSKEQILHGICQFVNVDLSDPDEQQRLIDAFINAIYVYDDKMVAVFNYQDGEKIITFDEVNAMLAKKENPDNRNDYQGSPLDGLSGPSRTRTADRPVMSREL